MQQCMAGFLLFVLFVGVWLETRSLHITLARFELHAASVSTSREGDLAYRYVSLCPAVPLSFENQFSKRRQLCYLVFWPIPLV